LIKELADKNLLKDGIYHLLQAASFEHTNVPLMKHLLRTASFAKTFPEADGFDNKYYVDMVKTLVTLSKIRNSATCARAITYNQFKQLKPKALLTQLLLFRDYQLAMDMIENLDLK
jgi:hypothetical protein